MQVDRRGDAVSSAEWRPSRGPVALLFPRGSRRQEEGRRPVPQDANWVVCAMCRHLSTQEPALATACASSAAEMLGKLLPGAVAVAAPLPAQP